MSDDIHEDDVTYTARTEYLEKDVAETYVETRFSGPLGRYRFRREQDAVNRMIDLVDKADVTSILDCPTGIGRWLPNLMTLEPERVVGMDVSPAMLRRAEVSASERSVPATFQLGVAEELPFAPGEFDLVFCHALLKHLPPDVQANVIQEIARVTTKYAIIAASIRTGLPGAIRVLRRARGAVAVTAPWFEEHVASAGFSIQEMQKATTPIGVEYSVLLRKDPPEPRQT